ncbi:MAG: hypothetical protein JJ896_14515 [Rhodothermales bacterium]|nr:hypothetical protein [Rhodothermales bacterium]MBO6780864.1 hypothetical protein [Rhodothermales bacterium]
MTGIGAYPVDLGVKDVLSGMYGDFDYDDDGIPRYRYPSGLHYNVTFVCHEALYELGLYQKTGVGARLNRFLHLADWLLGHGDETAVALHFPYTMPLPQLPAPWISALGQGRAISVLTRAWQATGRDIYLTAAKKALQPFFHRVADGGVQTAFPDGGVAFEEYPREETNIVLNGLITSLFGVLDLAACGHAKADKLFARATQSLSSNFALYDLGYWSAYDLTGPIRRVAGDEYHAYHVQLTWALYELTGDDQFRAYAYKWSRYRKGARLSVRRTLSRANAMLKYREW